MRVPPGDGVVTDAMAVRLGNDVAELPRLARLVQEFCEEHELPPTLAFSFDLALEEAVTNVITYGYDDEARHEIEVRMSVAEGIVRAEVTDDGRPFDPREVPPPDVHAPLADRPVGGLGAFLIRRSMDEIDYRVVAGRNHLTLSRRLP
jgi:anti-sigma regulatory factor (Ser/Thr protein kinase)